MTEAQLLRIAAAEAIRAAALHNPWSYLSIECRQYIGERRWQDTNRNDAIYDEGARRDT